MFLIVASAGADDHLNIALSPQISPHWFGAPVAVGSGLNDAVGKPVLAAPGEIAR